MLVHVYACLCMFMPVCALVCMFVQPLFWDEKATTSKRHKRWPRSSQKSRMRGVSFFQYLSKPPEHKSCTEKKDGSCVDHKFPPN
jgi:hypothetical protein